MRRFRVHGEKVMNVVLRAWAAFVLSLVALVLAPSVCHAISGTVQIAWKGRPVEAKPQWPRGLLTFLNSPQRASGWNPFFSEMPNDCDYYEFDARNTDEINGLIQTFARIDSQTLQICLSPEKGPRSIGWHAADPVQAARSVLFSLGDQETIDKWYARQPDDKKRSRSFPPKAIPPTLTIFVQHPAVDLLRLNIPAHVRVVTTFVPPNANIDQPTREVMDRIEQLQAARNRP